MKKEKLEEAKSKVKEKIKKEKKEDKEVKYEKAIVTSRVLFVSVLDKIYLGILGLWFIIGTISNFSGDIASLNYGFFRRLKDEIIFLIILVIVYLFLNWLYKCVAKTMLCLTKDEVYREHYIPFKRTEDTIPLNKITKVSTVNFLWIFRSIIIHQYHAFPLIFFTWNNREFKDELTELLTKRTDKVENEYKNRNIITKEMYKIVFYIGIFVLGIITLLGIIRLFAFMFSNERNIAGTYSYEDKEIVLNKNGTCDISKLVDNTFDCTWTYDSEDKELELDYKYKYGSFYTTDATKIVNYDTKEKVIEYNGMKFSK